MLNNNRFDNKHIKKQKTRLIFARYKYLSEVWPYFCINKAFYLWQKTFIQILIFHYFDNKYYIYISTNVSSYAIIIVFYQLILDNQKSAKFSERKHNEITDQKNSQQWLNNDKNINRRNDLITVDNCNDIINSFIKQIFSQW